MRHYQQRCFFSRERTMQRIWHRFQFDVNALRVEAQGFHSANNILSEKAGYIMRKSWTPHFAR